MTEATENLYQAPEADVTPEPCSTELNLMPPRSCGIGAGWRWFTRGYGLFAKGVGASIGMFVVYLATMIILGLIPVVNIVSSLVGIIFMAGFIVAAHRAHTEETIKFADLFAGFKTNAGKLVLVALLYILLLIVAFAIAALLGGGSFFALMSGEVDPATASSGVILFFLIMFALMIPVIMALWFAPALVILNDFGPVNAMTTSFKACLKNMLPFLLFGIVALVVMIISIIPLGLGLLITLPAMFYSTYAAYRDIFIDHES